MKIFAKIKLWVRIKFASRKIIRASNEIEHKITIHFLSNNSRLIASFFFQIVMLHSFSSILHCFFESRWESMRTIRDYSLLDCSQCICWGVSLSIQYFLARRRKTASLSTKACCFTKRSVILRTNLFDLTDAFDMRY